MDDSYRKWSDYNRNQLEQLNKLHDQFRSSGLAAEIQKMQARSAGFVSEIQKMQAQFRSSGLAAEIQKMQALSTSFVSEIQKMQIDSTSSVITRLSEMTENLRNVDYVINPDGTITSQNGIFNQSAIQSIIESYLETAHEADNVSFETKIDNILNDILKHHPVISKIIVYVLLPLFISILSPIYFPPTVQIDYNLIAKQIKKEVGQIKIDSEFYGYYRFVSAPSITVRSKNSTKSKYVGKLYFGNLVRIIQKKKNWSLIEYRDKEGNIIIQGWVFTRYIKRLN